MNKILTKYYKLNNYRRQYKGKAVSGSPETAQQAKY
jgi:hypothetical protein